jgi:serine/threonine protein kinase
METLNNKNQRERDELFAGRYVLESLVGSGGMGEVYRARDTLLADEKPIALKILHPQLCRDPRHAKRFLREVQLTRQVTHPNVIRTFDVGEFEGKLYFTMEFVQGESLADKIAEEPLPIDAITPIFLGIAKGLQAIHDAGIIHRDLKPANIIILNTGEVKIADFGVARGLSSDLTRDNEIIGSAPYMSPELWTGRDVGPAADLYALGIVAYEAISGILPLDGDSPAELMAKHLEIVPPVLIDLRHDCPRALSYLIARLVAKHIDERPASVAEVIEFLEQSSKSDEGRDAYRDVPQQSAGYTPSYSGVVIPAQAVPSVTSSSELSPFVSQGDTQSVDEEQIQRAAYVRRERIRGVSRVVAAGLALVSLSFLGEAAASMWRDYYAQGGASSRIANLVVTLCIAVAIFPLGWTLLAYVYAGITAAVKTYLSLAVIGVLLSFSSLLITVYSFNLSPVAVLNSLSKSATDTVAEVSRIRIVELGALAPLPSRYIVQGDEHGTKGVVVRSVPHHIIHVAPYLALWFLVVALSFSVVKSVVNREHPSKIIRLHPLAFTFVLAVPFAAYWALYYLSIVKGGVGVPAELSTIVAGTTLQGASLVGACATWIIAAFICRPQE